MTEHPEYPEYPKSPEYPEDAMAARIAALEAQIWKDHVPYWVYDDEEPNCSCGGALPCLVLRALFPEETTP